ncbi:hypothetical protein FMEAI12_3640067 [Parafrankia sp. Ea1.12]|nr:hypothetical protein FMEAI12_3640067 [Parafrankia sp. Ea1.12]
MSSQTPQHLSVISKLRNNIQGVTRRRQQPFHDDYCRGVPRLGHQPRADRYRGDVGLHLSQIAEADELLTNDPLALLIGMVLDQRVSERWSGI